MNVNPIKFYSYKPSFFGIKRRLEDSDFKTEVVEVEKVSEPVFYTAYGVKEIKQRQLRKIKNTIEEAKKCKKDNDGCCRAKRDYLAAQYNLPISFAIDVIKKSKRGEDTHIIDEIPQMFQGIDKNELLSTLDMLCVFLEDNDDEVIFEMGEKEFSTQKIGSGAHGVIYKITSENHPPLAFKVYKSPKQVSNHGPFGEIALERELNRAGVIDIPKLYMASPLGAEVLKGDEEKPCVYASWKISEFIDKDTPLKEGSLTLEKYLKRKNLAHGDSGYSNKVGKYCVDLGGVEDGGNWGFYAYYSYLNKTLFFDLINNQFK